MLAALFRLTAICVLLVALLRVEVSELASEEWSIDLRRRISVASQMELFGRAMLIQNLLASLIVLMTDLEFPC